MSCKAPSCSYKSVTKNATRARRHLLSCVLAAELYPKLQERLAPTARDGSVDVIENDITLPPLPPLPATTLASWRLQFARVQLESGLPFSTFDTEAWRSTLRLISGSRFDGPGSRRVVGRTHQPAVQSLSDKGASAFLRSCDSFSVSLDGMKDENGAGVYNIIVYTPRPFQVGTFRLGTDPGAAEILLGHLAAGLQGPLLAGVATSSAVELERGECPLSLISSCRLLNLCSDSPSAMVALRTCAVNRGMFFFAFDCAAHAAELVASDAFCVPVCAAALRGSLAITVFFKRSTRSKALLRAVRAMLAGGRRGVGSLRSYSRTRLAGEGATIAAVGANLPALRNTLLENDHTAAPIDIPDEVSAAIQSTTLSPAILRCSPFLCFLTRLVTHLEADAAPLSSYAGIFACLRAALANNFTALTVSERQTFQGVLGRRFAAFAHPMVVLLFSWTRSGAQCARGCQFFCRAASL